MAELDEPNVVSVHRPFRLSASGRNKFHPSIHHSQVLSSCCNFSLLALLGASFAIPLLRLPPEIVVQIFNEIGSFFFQQDLGRLSVCKQWFEFALPACFRHITLSRKTLSSLVTSGHIYEPSGYWLRALNDVATLNNDLTKLATIVQQSPRLCNLRIRICSCNSHEPPNFPGCYPQPATIQALLSVENLRLLVLDLSGCYLNSPSQQGDDHHLCPHINALLRTLRTLHVRMRSICPDVLKPRDSPNTLHLSEMVINLSLITNTDLATSAVHSKRCGSEGVGGFLQLKAEIEEQAKALATRMASPRKIRILSHALPQFEIRSLDVLTGKITVLDDDMAWDEDGKSIRDDSEPESELGEDEFETYLDD
ncbi:hypothetical protein QBC37DRAFT_476111 [Rhypophila decipiens]|uniref:F-box domain-containing protein n=1 Tax=Rhypophila decipiens TaxID=261697 RepID=A0AAN6Y2N2_9PEZI|nr:hypothetical protein QBC37DRAFT_476111 [Rhypophila decipiens]